MSESKSTRGSSTSPEIASVVPPPRIPDHELIRRIGRGAYGEVWIARSVTGAYRAVKIVRRSSFDHERPFEREFEGILKFEPVSRTHDSQVDILHVGHGEDYFYYVMELADDQATGGQINPDNYHPRTLKSDLLFHGHLPFEECVSIGIALTTALEHLHENGLVHRDVKPSNIIFVNGVAKLADIGLVTGVDTTRSYVGTEGFAAPEGPGTPQADVFSLGKVLYEMSTGKDRQEFPELPTNLRELPEREGLVELNAVIAKACRHDPRDRYPNAVAMRADLELLQSGKSLARLHRLERRLRLVTRFGATTVALALVVIAAWLYQRAQTREARNLAERNRQLAMEKTKLAEENRKQVVRLNVANGVRLIESEPTTAALWFSEALPLVTNNPAESSVHRLRIQRLFDVLPKTVQVLPHARSVTGGAFSPNGRMIATGTVEGELTVWDADSGTLQWMQRTRFRIAQLRFTKDGERLLIISSRPPNHGHYSGPQYGGGVGVSGGGVGIISVTNQERIFWQTAKTPFRAVLSPDARWIALGESNHTITVVDTQTGGTASQMKGHTDAVTTLTFTPDGTFLVSGSADKTVRLWRFPSGEPASEPFEHDAMIRRAVLSANGQRLATMSDSVKERGKWTVQVWDVATQTKLGSPISVTVEHQESTLDFLDPVGKWIFVSGDKTIGGRRAYFLDVETGDEILPTERLQPRSWAMSPDRQNIAVGTDGGVVSIFDTKTGVPVFPRSVNEGWVESLTYNHDGSKLLVTRNSGTAVVLSVKRPSPSAELRFSSRLADFSREAYLNGIDQHSGRIIVPLKDGTIRVVDVQQVREICVLRSGLTAEPRMASFSRDGRNWAAFSKRQPREDNKIVELWHDDNGTLRRFLLEHPASVDLQRFIPSSTHLLTSCLKDRSIREWRTADGVLSKTVSFPENMTCWKIGSDGLTIYLRQQDTGENHIFDFENGTILKTSFKLPSNYVYAKLHEDSGRLAVATDRDNSGRIWNIRTGEPLTPPFRQGGTIHSLAWSPDGRQILTAGLGSSKVWDAATGKLALPPLGHMSSHVTTWSQDGRFIVALDDQSATVLDGKTGDAVAPQFHVDGYVRLATVVGNRLVILSDPDVLQAWDLKECNLPVDVISDYARLLSASASNASGVPNYLQPHELAGLLRSLKTRAPELFKQ